MGLSAPRIWLAQRLDRAVRILRGAYWAFEGSRDRQRLEDRLPGLRALWTASAPLLAAELSPVYRAYVSTVSTPRMAISLELATFLLALCKMTRPQRLLDLGSGFSSYVFRRYQSSSGHAVEVCSVDRSERWLDQTRLFLSAQGLQTANMETWEAFSTRSAAPYDIIFYDLGKGRHEFLPAALPFRNRSGLFVLDDFQILRYRKAVRRSLRGKPYVLFSLSSYTRDRYLRFSALVTDVKSTT